jgi:hypothetical protein
MELSQLSICILTASKRYHKLLLLAGQPGSGKTRLLLQMSEQERLPYINLSHYLSKRLMEVNPKYRSLEVNELMAERIGSIESGVVLIDNIEILFSFELKIDPLKLLYAQSKNKTLVTAWPGEYDGRRLSYAEPWHGEYASYEDADALVVNLP